MGFGREPESTTHVEKTIDVAAGSGSDCSAREVGAAGADYVLQRRLSSRHITMIALGSSIGMGLWLGSGINLHKGGPAAIFFGYLLSGSMIWAVSQSIGEMAVMYPLPSAFVQWSNKFVSPAAGFSLGWAYYCFYFITIANELNGVLTVLSFWDLAVPKWALIIIFWLVIVFVNVGAVSLFGEIEVVCSAIKFGWIFVVIATGIVISAGGAPVGDPIGFRYWNESAFTNGFKGFLSVMPTCIFAMAGSENAALAASETENPRKSVPMAVGSMWVRLALFYLLGSLVVTITVSPFNKDLLGSGGTNASPFVVAYRDSGLQPLAHMMNSIIFVSVLSTGSISGYAGSRTLVGLSQISMAPKKFGRTDRQGRPWWALVPTLLIGFGLAFLNVSASGAQVFEWLANLTSLFTLFGWGMVCFCNIRMRAAWKAQGRHESELSWRSWTWPWGAYWGLAWCIILLVVEFYLAVSPLNKPTTAENFLANYVSFFVIMITLIGAWFYYRGPLLNPLRSIDLDEGRRIYLPEHQSEVARQSGFLHKAVAAFRTHR